MDCFVCTKHASAGADEGGVIYEDELVFASHGIVGDRTDAYLGHLFAEPKRHVAGLGELTGDEAAALGRLANDLAGALRRSEGAEHVYLFVFGHDVPHLHLHLVARYPGTPREWWGPQVSRWPDGPRGDLAAARAMCERLRAAL